MSERPEPKGAPWWMLALLALIWLFILTSFVMEMTNIDRALADCGVTLPKWGLIPR